jgi:hypothetical protein
LNSEGATTKTIINIKDLSWLCGRKLLCKPEDAMEKFKTMQIKKDEFKNRLTELYAKLGSESVNCIADEYMFGVIQKAIVFCFKTPLIQAEFNNLFSKTDDKKMEPNALVDFDPKSTQTFLLYLSDGRNALLEKKNYF